MLGLIGWQINQVIEVYRVEIGVLPGAEAYVPVSEKRIDTEEKTVVAVFALDKEGETTLIDSLSIISVGHWRLDLPVNVAIMIDQSLSVYTGKLYYAGERLSNQTTGLEYLVGELEKIASVKIDGYIAMDVSNCDQKKGPCTVSELSAAIEPFHVWLSPSRAKAGLERTYSNCDTHALQSVLWAGFDTASDSVTKTIPLSLLESANIQGEQVYYLRAAAVSDVIQSFPVPADLMVEQARVEVYNGTDFAGLAGTTARVFENSGINVTRVEDAPLRLEETTIFVKNYEKYTNTVATIKHDLADKASVLQAEPNFLTAGDVVVVMGYNGVE